MLPVLREGERDRERDREAQTHLPKVNNLHCKVNHLATLLTMSLRRLDALKAFVCFV